MLSRAKKPEAFVAPLFQVELEPKDEFEDAGDSMIVDCEKLEEFGPRDDRRHKESQQKLAVGEPKTQDTSVHRIAEIKEKKQPKTDTEDQPNFSDCLLAMSILAIIVLIPAYAAYIVFNLIF